MVDTDRHGTPLSSYPATYRHAHLLGINGEGIAEYTDGEIIFLAELDGEGDLHVPPPEYGLAHELSLDAFDWTIAEYLHHSETENGPWRALTPYGQRHYSSLESTETENR